MTLSDAAFSASWAILCDRFNRQFNDATVRIYRRILSEEMTDEQLREACAAAFRFETFFPSPQQLIEYGLGGKGAESRARKVWGLMVENAQRGDPATQDQQERRILMRATNGQPLGTIPHERLHWVERSFVKLYADHVMEQAQSKERALAPLTMKALGNGAA